MTEPTYRLPRRAHFSGTALLVLVVALLVGNAVWIVRNCNALRALGPGQPAPGFDLPTLAGDRVRLSDLRGRVVLLDFWAYHCGPCWTALEHLNAIQARYAGKPLTILGIHTRSRTRDKERATAVAAKLKLRFQVLWDTAGISDKYTVRLLPTTVLVGKKGKVRKVWRGVVSETTLEDAIDKELKK